MPFPHAHQTPESITFHTPALKVMSCTIHLYSTSFAYSVIALFQITIQTYTILLFVLDIVFTIVLNV